MKNSRQQGHSARHGNRQATYTKYDKRPYTYHGQARLANGTLKNKANDRLQNKYL